MFLKKIFIFILKKLPIIVAIILLFFLDNLESLFNIENDKIDYTMAMIVTIAAVFAGFLMTILTAIGTANNSVLQRISKNEETSIILIYNVTCIILYIFLMVFAIFYSKFPIKLIIYFFIVSLLASFWYIYICCKIFYKTLKELHEVEEKRIVENKKTLFEMKKEFEDLLEIINKNILNLKQ